MKDFGTAPPAVLSLKYPVGSQGFFLPLVLRMTAYLVGRRNDGVLKLGVRTLAVGCSRPGLRYFVIFPCVPLEGSNSVSWLAKTVDAAFPMSGAGRPLREMRRRMRMAESSNKFVWYDLMTSDLAGAAAFYGSVVGWGSMDSGMAERPYHLFTMGQTVVAGLMPPPADAKGAPSLWVGYVGVEDVDATAAKLKAAGGNVWRGPEDIPNNVGRFAVVSDAQGVPFSIFKPNGPEQPGDTQFEPGRVGWHELHARDWKTAWDFYSGLFAWTLTEDMDMGPMGTYRMFATGGKSAVGGIMTKADDLPMPLWLFYFNVDAIDAAAARVKEGGGQVVNGPMQVPGGAWVIQATDPQGAMFAAVSMVK